MDLLYRHQAPELGNWEWSGSVQFARYLEKGSPVTCKYESKDAYFAGDLYRNDVGTPTVVVVPRRKKGKKEMKRTTVKPVDEDLYKIPPELLYSEFRKKGRFSFISRCFVPVCSA